MLLSPRYHYTGVVVGTAAFVFNSFHSRKRTHTHIHLHTRTHIQTHTIRTQTLANALKHTDTQAHTHIIVHI